MPNLQTRRLSQGLLLQRKFVKPILNFLCFEYPHIIMSYLISWMNVKKKLDKILTAKMFWRTLGIALNFGNSRINILAMKMKLALMDEMIIDILIWCYSSIFKDEVANWINFYLPSVFCPKLNKPTFHGTSFLPKRVTFKEW